MEYDKDLQSIQEVRNKVAKAKEAQSSYQEFSQEKMDQVVKAMMEAALKNAEMLAKMAKEETGYGRWEDKIVKNVFAAKYVYEAMKDQKVVGIIRDDKEMKVMEVGVPMGVIAGLIPSTNPTSTVIFKSLIALKAGNAIVFSPHPSALNCIKETIKILQDASISAGAPEGLIECINVPTVDGTNALMKHKDIGLILATGGEAMVKAAYSSGTPAIGVGPGNGPAFIERSADVKRAVSQILESKTFDNGVICASEQSVVVEADMKDVVAEEMKRQGFYFMTGEQSEKLGRFLLRPNMTMNPVIVGKSAQELARLSGIDIPGDVKVLVSFQDTVSQKNPYSREKLTTVLAFYTEPTWESACQRCLEILNNEGKGHTMTIHSQNEDIIREFALKKNVSRLLVNTPATLGGIGASTNLVPALTLGCGAVGGSSTSDNVGPMNLINIRRIAYGVRSLEEIKKDISACGYGKTEQETVTSTSNIVVDDLVRRIMNGI
ncbi:acetaldehyde dehydrogenase (acetylating) [Lacrimispora sp.]|uniref:acetaldehyde dehydrogenase (acetylating) n=1 Tax=Lacrimispora sp. TaxID=2719234 RepID=UPI0028ABFC67|nr:acetaldehyde dehydrogenase (acetylating) [Lacrimispora sp.]